MTGIVRRGPDFAGDAKDEHRRRLWVDLIRVGNQSVSSAMLLSVRNGQTKVAPGDTITFSAAAQIPRGFANPGEPDPRLALAAQGVDVLATLPDFKAVKVLCAGAWWGPRRLAHKTLDSLRQTIAVRMQGQPQVLGFLRTTVLGERATVDPSTEDGFRAAGATHVLSVSGLHLAAIAAAAFVTLRWCLGRWSWLAVRARPEAVAAALATPLVAFYDLVTGEAIATSRSAVMAGVVFAGRAMARRPSAAATIALAALILLLSSPLSLMDVSFQLTFASVVALAVFSRRLAAPTTSESAPFENAMRSAWHSVGRWLRGFWAATAAAGLATAPLVAFHFGEVILAAPIGNLILVPLVEMLVVPFGILGAVLGTLHPRAGQLPLLIAGCASRVALAAAAGFLRFAPVWNTCRPTAFETVALMTAAAGALTALAWPQHGRKAVWAMIVFASGAAASMTVRAWHRQHRQDLAVTFIDVGQGDAALVEGPGGFTALVDAGGLAGMSLDIGERVVVPLLQRRQIGHLDLVVLSHPHPDHMGGLPAVLRKLSVSTLWTSGDDGHDPAYGRMLALARERGVQVPSPAATTFGEVRIAPCGPWIGDHIAAPPGLGINDASLSIRLSWAKHSIFFAGDLEQDGEQELLGRVEAGLPIAADVLKMPHHGSRTSSTDELLDAIRPRFAVMSLGFRNHFGFPHPEVTARYRTHGITVFRTDRDGAITLTVGKSDVWQATCERGCR